MVKKYVPGGVAIAGGGDTGPPPVLYGEPEPPQAKANIVNTTMQIIRFILFRFMPNANDPVPSRSPNARTTSSLGAFSRDAVDGAVVVIVT
jgi:hypothetical protein